MYHEEFSTGELLAKADQLLEHFDFEKVHAHMEATNWNWATSEGYKIPSIDQIKDQAHRLLINVIWEEEHVANISTGGFHAYKMPWGLELTFSLAWGHR